MSLKARLKSSRLLIRRNLWILIVIIFALATAGSVYETILEPSRENETGATVKVFIVAAMIYVARRDILEMDGER